MTRALPLLTWRDRKRPRAYSPPKDFGPKEMAIHCAIVDLMRRFAKPDWQWTHFPAGELRSPQTGAKLKRMGLALGWPDLVLLAPATGNQLGGLVHFVEIKRAKGDLTDDQEEFQAWCVANGVPHCVVRSVDEAIPFLEAWGCLRVRISSKEDRST